MQRVARFPGVQQGAVRHGALELAALRGVAQTSRGGPGDGELCRPRDLPAPKSENNDNESDAWCNRLHAGTASEKQGMLN